MSREEKEKKKSEGKPLIAEPVANPVLLGLSPSNYLAKTVKDIRSNDIEEALLVLPFSSALKLVNYLLSWIKQVYYLVSKINNTQGTNVELSCRCLFFLLKIHNSQLVTNKSIVGALNELRQVTRARLRDIKDTIGFNKAACQFLKRTIEANSNTEFFEASLQFRKSKKQKVK